MQNSPPHCVTVVEHVAMLALLLMVTGALTVEQSLPLVLTGGR